MGAGIGSEAPHPPPSLPEDHGSNSAELVDDTACAFKTGAAMTAGFGVGADKLNAELMFVLGAGRDVAIGVDTFVGGGTGGGAGDAEAKPENSSLANRSLDAAGTAGFGAVNAEEWAKEKSRPFNDELALGTEGCCCCWTGFGGVLSKKLPPLKGGGDITCGADGVDLGL